MRRAVCASTPRGNRALDPTWNGMKTRRKSSRLEHVRLQYAALPYRLEGRLEIMLITSRETRRWVVPKGWPMKGRRPRGTAAREALEEAGITGDIEKQAFGSYAYIKRGLGGQRWPCEVKVFPLLVRKERENWRERDQRTRHWFDYRDAAEAVIEPGLRDLILAFGIALLSER
jgi:8-oxo-dGTP pyrophosphatase MutT (NUDIX family)